MAKSLFNSREELERAAKAGDVDALRELRGTLDHIHKDLDENLVNIFVWIADKLVEKDAAPRSQFHQDLDSEAIRQIKRAIIAWAESCAPEKKRWIPELGKPEDHWGLTETGITRTIENNKALGWNDAVDTFLDNLRRGK